MNTLVTIATYERSKTAYFLKEELERENIDCYFSIVSRTGKRLEHVKVQVKDDDVEKAIRIMFRIKEEYGADIEEIEPLVKCNRIMVPVDFSLNSEYACYYAIHIARLLKSEIKLLHVYENPVLDVNIKESATFEDYVKQTLRDKEIQKKEDIMEFTQKMKAYIKSHDIDDVKIHSSIVMGNIYQEMKGICKIYCPDIVVLGSMGKEEGSKSGLSTLVSELTSSLRVPVYVIPGPTTPKDFEKMNILYATDFNENEHASLDQLISLMEPFNNQITCIHIDTAQNPAKKERMDELNTLLGKDYGKHEISCQLIESKDVYLGIKEFADTNRHNLLSFTIQKRGIFDKLFKPNFYKKILQEANIPILVFPS